MEKKLLNKYPEKIFLGTNIDNKRIYLSAPSWDCGWYWGFGYLGNTTCHYHVDGLKTIRKYNVEKKVHECEFVNLFDGFKRHFRTFIVEDDKDLWELCDLFETFYTLRKSAELFHRGYSHYTDRVECKNQIKNDDYYNNINGVMFPIIFDEIYKILLKYKK